jgi:hypothetical protein
MTASGSAIHQRSRRTAGGIAGRVWLDPLGIFRGYPFLSTTTGGQHHRRSPRQSGSLMSPHLAHPLAPALAHALAQASVHPGHSLSSSGCWSRSRRPRPRRQNSRILRGLSTKSRRCHRVTSAADKAGDRDRTGYIQLGSARAHDQNPSESSHFRRAPRSLAHALAQGRAQSDFPPSRPSRDVRPRASRPGAGPDSRASPTGGTSGQRCGTLAASTHTEPATTPPWAGIL